MDAPVSVIIGLYFICPTCILHMSHLHSDDYRGVISALLLGSLGERPGQVLLQNWTLSTTALILKKMELGEPLAALKLHQTAQLLFCCVIC